MNTRPAFTFSGAARFIIVLMMAATACESLRAAPNPGDSSGALVPYLGENGRYGYADSQGKPVIPAAWCHVDAFSEGRARVLSCDKGLWGVIDQRGRWIAKPTFDSISSFHDGEAYAYTSKTVDDTGLSDRLLAPLGAAMVAGCCGGGVTSGGRREKTTNVYYRLDASGKVREKWQEEGYNTISPSFSRAFESEKSKKWRDNTPAGRADNARSEAKDHVRWQFLQNVAQWKKQAASCGYELARSASGGDGAWEVSVSQNIAFDDYAVVTSSKQDGLGIIDKQCRLRVPFGVYGEQVLLAWDRKTKGAARFHLYRNLLIAKKKGEGFGVLDVATNTEVIPFDRANDEDALLYDDEANSFAEPLIAVKNDDGRWGLFKASGQPICRGFAHVGYPGEFRFKDKPVIAVMTQNNLWGALTPDGVWVVEPRYGEPFYFDERGYAWVSASSEPDGQRRAQIFVIDRSGREFRAGGKTSSEYTGARCEAHGIEG